jgi:hypothetical protein
VPELAAECVVAEERVEQGAEVVVGGLSAQIVDITHGVQRYAVRQGALVPARQSHVQRIRADGRFQLAARALGLELAVAGTGIRLSDGSTNML